MDTEIDQEQAARHITSEATLPTAQETGVAPKPLTLRREVWDRLKEDKLALTGLGLILLMIVVAVFAPFLAPHNPDTLYTSGLTSQGAPVPPGANGYVLGSDTSGRDLLSRLMYGGRASLYIGIIANAVTVLIGVAAGLVAAFFGGWVDMVIMRLTDVMMSLPSFLFALALVSVLQPGIGVIIFVIAFVSWTATCRIVHGQVLSLREKEFIEAARCLGIPTRRILLRHILPHLVSPIIVYTTLGVATTVVFEASLSYIGLGVQPPTPSWGKMAADGAAQLSYPWLIIFPGLAILLTVLGFNLLGDGLRDAFDPWQRR